MSAPRLGPRGIVKRTRIKSSATLEPLDQGRPTLGSSASAPALKGVERPNDGLLEIQEPKTSKVLPDTQLRPEETSSEALRAELTPSGWGEKPLAGWKSDWRMAAARAVEDRARHKKQVGILLQEEVDETNFRSLPRQDAATFEPPQRELTAYERLCFAKRLLPKYMARVKEAIKGPMLDLSSVGLGDDQLIALLADRSLVPCEEIRRWRLRDARMRDRGAMQLAKLLTEVEDLDLVNNEIGLEGARSLGEALYRRSCLELQHLDLSANSLNDEAAAALAKGLKGCQNLLHLDLRQNCLQDGQHLGDLIAEHNQLTRISLRRNRISGLGMAKLFGGVLENARAGGQLADVDVAWNPMADGLLAAQKMALVFQESATLYHCDLSYCNLAGEACATLGEGLRDNHSLYGLHVVGNAVTMDADGFLRPLDARPDAGRSEGVRFGGPQAGPEALLGAQSSLQDDLRGRDVLEMRSACWACEGWERMEISWPCEDEEAKVVWAFTSLDAFRRPLRLRYLCGAFRAARMVPPKHTLKVIFQVDSRLRLSPHEPREKQAVEIMLRISQDLPELSPDEEQVLRADISPRSGRKIFVVKSEEVNVFRSETGKCVPHEKRGVVIDGPADGSVVLLPRVTETEFKAQAKRAPPFWSGFKHETPSLRRESLRTDWMRCRLGHVVPESEIEEIKKVLEPNYGWLMCFYRRVSAMDASGELGFGISQIQAGELMMGCGICDGSTTKVADIDRFFIAAKVTPAELKKTMVLVNDKTLVRYEFLELLLRVAHHHFLKSGAVETMAEATEKILKCFEEEGRKEEKQLQRFFQMLCTEAIDNLVKKHSDGLAIVYKRFGGSKTPPGKPKFMAFGEFQQLLELANVQSLGFQLRQSSLAFRMGMMCQTDESGSSRFQEMSFLEFQVALSAVAFLSSDGPLLPTLQRLFPLFLLLGKGSKEKPK